MGHAITKSEYSRTLLEREAIAGDSPVREIQTILGVLPSTTEHVKFCGNLGRPLPKAKYSLVTDSEPVP